MKVLRTLAALALVACVAACSSLNVTVGSNKSVNAALLAYADIYQPAVMAYGSLPVCPAAALCRQPAVHAQLKAADLAVSKSVEAARPVLSGSLPDHGELLAVLEAVSASQALIVRSGIMTGGH